MKISRSATPTAKADWAATIVCLTPPEIPQNFDLRTGQCLDDAGVQVEDAERLQRRGPIERFRDPRRLIEREPADFVYEAHHLLAQFPADLRHTRMDDLQLLFHVWVFDPVIQAAALERITEFARAV